MLSLNVFMFMSGNPNNNCYVMINSFCFFPFRMKNVHEAKGYLSSTLCLYKLQFIRFLFLQLITWASFTHLWNVEFFFSCNKNLKIWLILGKISLSFRILTEKSMTRLAVVRISLSFALEDPARIKDLLQSEPVRGIIQVPDSSTWLCW